MDTKKNKIEKDDFYMENGFFVFTEKYHLKPDPVIVEIYGPGFFLSISI